MLVNMQFSNIYFYTFCFLIDSLFDADPNLKSFLSVGVLNCLQFVCMDFGYICGPMCLRRENGSHELFV